MKETRGQLGVTDVRERRRSQRWEGPTAGRAEAHRGARAPNTRVRCAGAGAPEDDCPASPCHLTVATHAHIHACAHEYAGNEAQASHPSEQHS